MKRKTVDIKLSDGKLYVFSERNREDIDYSALAEELRRINLKIIQDSVTDKDQQLALMLTEMKRVYSPVEISFLLLNKLEHQLKMAYDSFKIANEKTSINRFEELTKGIDLPKVCLLINSIEGNDSEEVEKKKTQGHG